MTIGTRVPSATATDKSTITWQKPMTNPGKATPASLIQKPMPLDRSPSVLLPNHELAWSMTQLGSACATASRVLGRDGSYHDLKTTTQTKNQPSRTVINKAANKRPKNLPSKNWRREIGLLISVTAVRPSISSLTEMLAAITANTAGANIVKAKHSSLTIL